MQYEERLDEGKARSTVKVSENGISIWRKGSINSKMVFQTDKKIRGKYETPYGTIEIFTKTKRIFYTYIQDQKKGKLDLEYELEMNGTYTGTYHLEMLFEEDKNEHS